MAVRVAVAGATGYAGQELVRIMARHPCATLTVAMASKLPAPDARKLPGLARIWDGELTAFSADVVAEQADAVFLALPEQAAAEAAPRLVESGVRVFDLSGAFRLRDASQRARWYPDTPADAMSMVVYGLTERNREAIKQAKLVSCPGCYPTAALLALEPLRAAQLLRGDIIIDAKSGISGAGKSPTERTHFSENHGSVAAYKIFSHRHGAEIAQELGWPSEDLNFVPHLVPLDRGILETIYVRLRPGTGASDVAAALHGAYDDAPFIRLTGETLPEIKHVVRTNFCDIGWQVDAPSGRAVLVACLDNLVKGAAGQAVQNFNLAFGFDERAGL